MQRQAAEQAAAEASRRYKLAGVAVAAAVALLGCWMNPAADANSSRIPPQLAAVPLPLLLLALPMTAGVLVAARPALRQLQAWAPVLYAVVCCAAVYAGLVWAVYGWGDARATVYMGFELVLHGLIGSQVPELLCSWAGAEVEADLRPQTLVQSYGRLLVHVSAYRAVAMRDLLLDATTVVWASWVLTEYEALLQVYALIIGSRFAEVEGVAAHLRTLPSVRQLAQLPVVSWVSSWQPLGWPVVAQISRWRLLSKRTVMVLTGCALCVWIAAGSRSAFLLLNLLFAVAALSRIFKLDSVHMQRWTDTAGRRLLACDNNASAAVLVWRVFVAYDIHLCLQGYGISPTVYFVNCFILLRLAGVADLLTPGHTLLDRLAAAPAVV